MAAFSWNTHSQLQGNVRHLYWQRRKLARLILSHEDYIQAFVPAQQRQLFREIASHARSIADDGWVRLNWTHSGGATIRLALTMQESTTSRVPPIPHHLELQPDAPQGVVDRINHWITNGGDVSRDYGRVMKVLGALNEHCSRNTLRYYWPSIIAICSVADNTKVLAAELQELKTPASPKPLPQGLSAACRLTAETIATTLLIPEEARIAEGEVILEAVSGQEYTEPGLGHFFGIS
ncbi:MAG: hypothetical protein ACXU89_18780 [Xanthobacteraceae bacterium]